MNSDPNAWSERLRRFRDVANAYSFRVAVSVCTIMVMVHGVLQYREDVYLREVALRVVNDAHASTQREQVIALRDYIRANIRHEQAPYDDRPFLRATAVETLNSKLGYCGEVSRLFINMSRSVGVEAQRVNLYGPMMHVVAEVELEPRKRLVVDAQNPPTIVDLQSLDEVILRPEFEDYYNLNLRRLHLGWLVSRVRLEMGGLTYWVENPHALTAAMWGAALFALLALKGSRSLLRMFLLHRGWVHRSTLSAATPSDRQGVLVGPCPSFTEEKSSASRCVGQVRWLGRTDHISRCTSRRNRNGTLERCSRAEQHSRRLSSDTSTSPKPTTMLATLRRASSVMPISTAITRRLERHLVECATVEQGRVSLLR